jgi:hypothetical protein
MSVSWALAALCLLLGLPSVAHAERHRSIVHRSVRSVVTDPCLRHPGCRYHVETATILSGAELEGYALAEYQAAYALRKTPWLLFNIARILHRLNRLPEAIPYYQKYLGKKVFFEDERSIKAQKFLTQAKQDMALLSVQQASPVLLPAVTHPRSEGKPDTPIYQKPWLWATVGIVSAIVAVGITGGVMAATRSSWPPPEARPPFNPFQ